MNTCLNRFRDNPWRTHTVRIDDITHEADGVETYQLRLAFNDGNGTYDFNPGQFNMLYLPGVGESAISMSGNPSKPQSWTHTVRSAGNVTKMLAKLSCGDTLGLRGPFGTGWPIDQLRGNDVIIVAGGLGMAPLRPLIYQIINDRAHYGQVWLICGARTSDGLLYRREFDAWRRCGIEILQTVDRATAHWSGQIGVVTLLIERLQLPHPLKTHLVACGPEVMMKYAVKSGLRLGLEETRVWISLERNMQCAAGLCGHCQLGPEFLCKDGPVLRYDRIRKFLFVEQL